MEQHFFILCYGRRVIYLCNPLQVLGKVAYYYDLLITHFLVSFNEFLLLEYVFALKVGA